MSSPTKRRRRTKAEIQCLKQAMYNLIENERPMTVRQVFYRMVSMGLIRKTEGEYKSTVCRLLTDMRKRGEMSYRWITDNTRWMRKPRTYSSLKNALLITAETYRRSLWENGNTYVEVWSESDAIAGVLYEETSKWDVPLMVIRGYSSLSFLYSAGQDIEEMGKAAYLYYCGDYDPSGRDIARWVEERIREFAPNTHIHFETVAVTPDQIKDWNLPTEPAKKTDSRSKTFDGETVQIEAIPPTKLRSIISDRIECHIDRDELHELIDIERLERETLYGIIDRGVYA